MTIELQSDLFLDFSNIQDINFILALFADNRRYDYYCDLPSIKDSEIFNSLTSIQQEQIAEYYERKIITSSKINHSIASQAKEDTFNLEEAKRFFIQPLQIILENSLNDSYFLKALFNNFKKQSRKIKRHLSNGYIVFQNAGGCNNISNEIDNTKNSFDKLPKENHKYLRCFILIDSDKSYPKQEHSQSRKNLLEYLDQNKITSFHILEKREMENYLPDEVLKKIDDPNDFIKSYLNLNPIQKDYFDIEKGFPDKNINSMGQEIQELYGDVSEETFHIFRKNGLASQEFKSEFPKYFNSDLVTRESLLKRTEHQDNPNELVKILSQLNKLL